MIPCLDMQFKSRSGKFEGYVAGNAINALTFNIQAGVAASYLMSRRYKSIIQSTDATLHCNNTNGHRWYRRSDNCKHRYTTWSDRDWEEDQKYDYARIYYCRALALRHMGKTSLAVENMEKAIGFDAGDGTIFAQLVLLKRKLEQEKIRRNEKIRSKRARKLNVEQRELRKKQESRRVKAQD